jgi:ABC-type dipeptide/oligopeptide/nickel transport system permease component/ABC-type dipeptide/oligopeptide/nickel transport system permease subunit
LVPNIVKNVLYFVIVSLAMLFLGLYIVFMIMVFLPGDPVLVYLPPSFNQAQYDAMRQALGFNDPLLIQFIRFVFEFFTWNWGISGTIAKGMPTIQLVIPAIFQTLVFALFPIILGIIAGMVLGVLSVKIRYKIVKILFQIGIILGISLPVIYAGFNQLYVAFILGLPLLIGEPILPSITLFFITSALMMRQFRSNFIDAHQEKRHSVPSNIVKLCLNFNLIFMMIVLLEIIFGLNGFGNLFLTAISYLDYYVVRSMLGVMLFLMITLIAVFGVIFSLYSLFAQDIKLKPVLYITESEEQYFEETERSEVSFGKDLKQFTIRRFKSPFTYIGLAIVVFAILLSIFPIILTPLTYEEAIGIYGGPFDPPSPAHPLGQTQFGRDVLVLMVYGIRFSLILGIYPVLIGILGGVLISYLSRFHEAVKMILLAVLTLGFLLPTFAILIILFNDLGAIFNMVFIGCLLIPGFTIVFNKSEFKLRDLIKSALTYLPLFMGFTILFFEGLSFTGFSDPMIFQLGRIISNGRIHLYDAPWATLWPGIALFILCIGFFTLHYGLKEPIVFNYKRIVSGLKRHSE